MHYQNLISKPLLRVILCLAVFALGMSGMAQPSNDDCSDAELLCSSVTVTGTNLGATAECGGADGDCTESGSWGHCYDVENSVWYSFITNATGGDINVSIFGIQCVSGTGLEANILEIGQACDPTTYVSLACDSTTGSAFSMLASGLQPQTRYWIHVDGIEDTTNSECNFEILVKGQAVSWQVASQLDSSNCDQSTGSVTLEVQSGTAPYNYDWSDGQIDSMASGLAPGTYTVTITDAQSCDTALSFTLDQKTGPVTSAIVNDQLCGDARSGLTIGQPTGGTPPYLYSLNGDVLSDRRSYRDIPAGTYTILVRDDAGCDTTFVLEAEDRCPPLSVNNVLTPNSDGFNDNWVIGNIGFYPNNQVLLFDRWGQRIFSSNGYTEPWDGKSLGSIVPAATYYYVIYLDRDNRDGEVITGWVAVVN